MIKHVILLLLPFLIAGQKNRFKILYSKEFDNICEFQFREYTEENIPYTVIAVEEKFKNYFFCAYLKTADLPVIEDCTSKSNPLYLSDFRKKDLQFEKDNLLLYINKKKIDHTLKIDDLNIPQKLILFEDKKFQFLVFITVEVLMNSNNSTMRPETSTSIFKFDKKRNFREQFSYKSSKTESINTIYKRFLLKDKKWK